MNIKIKYCVAVAAAVAAAAFCACGRADEEVVPIERAAQEGGLSDVAQTSLSKGEQTEKPGDDAEPDVIKVYVCGAVKYPDVYTVDSTCRTNDAVEAAGGFLPDAGKEYINLAAAVSDGQKIYIPTKREIEDAFLAEDGMYSTVVNITSNTPGIESTNSTNTASPDGQIGTDLVDINSATRETLMTLPGIGASKADSIIAYRQANGGFSSTEDIMLVDGIKEGLFNKVKDRICAR